MSRVEGPGSVDVLVIGNQAREHALAYTITQSPQFHRLHYTHGNVGMSQLGTPVIHNQMDSDKLARYAEKNKIGLTVVGPDAPLGTGKGIVRVFEERGLLIFGPRKEAAMAEASKGFFMDFCKRHDIPHAESYTFTQDQYTDGLAFIRKNPWADAPVIKNDGYAQGKGVVISDTTDEAEAAFKDMIQRSPVVVQEFLSGPEVSIHALISQDRNGKNVTGKLQETTDEKRFNTGNAKTNKNTGGLGGDAPADILSVENHAQLDEMLQKFADGMQEEGREFQGTLYLNMILTKLGLKIIEANTRFGDPEAQKLTTNLESDLLSHLLAVSERRLEEEQIRWKQQHAVSVVLASRNYPASPSRGDLIEGVPLDISPHLENYPNTLIYHAGTAIDEGRLVTNGGRILTVVGTGATLLEAHHNAYDPIRAGVGMFNGRIYVDNIPPRLFQQ